MQIFINGHDTSQPDGITLLALLQTKQLDPATVVVERNQHIVPGEEFETLVLENGDHLEIVRFVGGG